eukprot:m.314593 g.314593  ORF g.314593 m.314593 type:complete len:93 (+) comp538129_c0_seq1:2-280(+)
MHMLESHVTVWMQTWRLGLGFHGEQGAESIHARFNRIENQKYQNLRNPQSRLLAVIKDYYVQVSPEAKSMAPPLIQNPRRGKKRKAMADSDN